MKHFFHIILIILLSISVIGCGSHKSRQNIATGSIKITVAWPEFVSQGFSAKAIPLNTQSFVIRIFINDKLNQTAILNRPETTVIMNNVRATTVVVQVKAYSGLDGSGDFLAGGETTIQVQANMENSATVTLDPNFRPIRLLSVDPIGESYTIQDGVPGIGSLCVNPDGTVWILSSNSSGDEELLKYKVNSGFQTSIPFSGGYDFLIGEDGNYCFKKITSGNYELYKLDSSSEPIFVENVSFSDYLTSQTANASFNFGINSSMIISVTDTVGGLNIVKTIRGLNTPTKSIISNVGNDTHIHGCALTDLNLYVLCSKQNSSSPPFTNYIYRINPTNLSLVETTTFTSGSQMKKIYKSGNNLYITAGNYINKFTLDGNGKLTSLTQTNFTIGSYSSTNGIFPYQNDYVFDGLVNNIDGVYLYKTSDNSVQSIFQPNLSGNILYNVYSAEANGNDVVIPCNNVFKIFNNCSYIRELETDIYYNYQNKISIASNQNGIIVASYGSQLAEININSSIYEKISPDLGGVYYSLTITNETNNTFIVRGYSYSAATEIIGRYNITDNSFSTLFTLSPDLRAQHHDIAILKDGNIILNGNTQLYIYSTTGGEPLKQKEYSFYNYINAITYSAYYDRILVLSASEIIIINPDTLEIESRINLPFTGGQDISVSSDGVVYIAVYNNTAYQVKLLY